MNVDAQDLRRGAMRAGVNRPLASVALGVVFAVAATSVVAWHQWPGDLGPQDFTLRFFATFGVPFGIMMLLGGVTAVVVVLSRRLPGLAAATAVVLLYGLLATGPPVVQIQLPYPEVWRFAGQNTFALLAGAMAAAAVWGFVTRRRPRPGPSAGARAGAAAAAGRREQAGLRWSRHLAAIVAGIVIGIAIQAATVLFLRPEFQLPVGAPSGLWLMLGILLAVGAMTTAVVLLSSRVPWLPTALALTLAYGTYGSLPPVTFDLDLPPYPDRLQPVFYFPSLNILAVVTGAALAAAVWGWRSQLRRTDTT